VWASLENGLSIGKKYKDNFKEGKIPSLGWESFIRKGRSRNPSSWPWLSWLCKDPIDPPSII